MTLGPDGAVVVPDGSPGAPDGPPPPSGTSFRQRIPRKFLLLGLVVVIIGAVAWWGGRGKTDAVDLQVGDCFEQPGATDITDVTDQSCSGSHETEIYAEIELGPDDPYPGDEPFTTEVTAAALACAEAADSLDVNVENIPDDLEDGYFFADRGAWDDGDRRILCYATSPTGIPGPLVDR